MDIDKDKKTVFVGTIELQARSMESVLDAISKLEKSYTCEIVSVKIIPEQIDDKIEKEIEA